MVKLQNIPLVRFLRALARAKHSSRWEELKGIIQQNIGTRPPGNNGLAFLLAPFRQGRRTAQFPPLFQMAAGYWISQSVYVAAKLGLPDAMFRQPQSCQELAVATGAQPDSLARLLRVLCTLGLCREQDGNFALTAQGRPLSSLAPGSLHAMVLTLGEIHYQAWGDLLHSIKTGQPAFDNRFGSGLFQYLTQNAQAGLTFNEAMTDFSGLAAYAVALAYDFSTIRSIVDVGGGHGQFLRTILEMNPHIQGTVLDLPGVIQGASRHLAALDGRCQAVAGDFFASVPPDADTYVLKGVIHDWDDSKGVAILRNCRKAMKPNARLLIVETIVPETKEPSFSSLLDLNMLVMCGGRERTASQFKDLFARAELRMTRIVSTLSPLKVIEARL
jgi:hypothetical protein